MTALQRGSIVHGLIERLDFRRPLVPSDEEIAAELERFGIERLPADVADLLAMVERVAGSQLRERIAAARRVRTELPFTFTLTPPGAGGRSLLMNGVVDVYAVEDSGTLVVDWKSDVLDGREPADIVAEGYATQRIVYALAALRAGAERVEVAHCFLERPDEPAVAVYATADAEGLERELLELARGVVEGSFVPSDEPHAGLCADCPGRAALCVHPGAHPSGALIAVRSPPRGPAHVNLGTRMARRDRAAFIGRAGELEAIAELFVDDPPASVVLVHGPGGIGKSALLRQVADRGREAGWSPVLVEGRELPPVADALEEALSPAHEHERPLILIDTYERMTALGSHLRRALLPSLPEHTIVVVAGRQAPERGWFEGGWEAITREIELGPLSLAESEELLGAHGLSGARRDELAHWAGGSPLALTLSIAAVEDGGWARRQARAARW